MSLEAGWARRDITPEPGIHMGGYWGRHSGATKIHDPLQARAIIWRGDGGAVCLLCLDLVALSAERVADLRQRVEAAIPGLPAAAVMVTCSHTHAGPLTLAFRGMGDVDEAYVDGVVAAAVEAVADAWAALAPASMSYARVAVQIGINRRVARDGATVIAANPEGPVSAHAHVVRLQTSAGGAVVFQHACHPVVLGSGNHEISRDFPGAAVDAIEAQTGDFAAFVNGAAGDINPRRTGGTHEDVGDLGRELGNAVVAGLDGATSCDVGAIAWGRGRLDLPLLPPPPAWQSLLEEAGRSVQAVLAKGGDEWAQRIPRAQQEWARACREAAQRGAAATQAFELQALRVGPVSWLGMEGEIFVDYQLRLEEASTDPVILCGYANGCVGYLPTAAEYGRGGYEVDQAYKVYPSVCMLAPESDDLVRARARDLLGGLTTSR